MNKTDLDNKLTNFNDESQNRFAYQPTLDTLELKKDKGTDYVHGSKSKWVYNSKLKPLYTALLDSIKLFGYKMEKKNWERSFSSRSKQLLYQNCKCLHWLWFRCLKFYIKKIVCLERLI